MTQEEMQVAKKSKETFKNAMDEWVRVEVKEEGISPYPHSTLKRIAHSVKEGDVVNLFISSRRHCIILQVSSTGKKDKMNYIYLNDRVWAELYYYFKVK